MKRLVISLGLIGVLVSHEAAAGAAQDIAAGQNMFEHGCVSCHDDSAYMVKADGPALFGVVGRPVGSVADFKYSPALQAANRNGDTWTTRRLVRFLANPSHMYPGTTMPWSFAALSDRRTMVAYLQSLKAQKPAFP